MSKRKHSETGEVATDGPRKTRVIEDETSTPRTSKSVAAKAEVKAAARQAKSERRAKKADKEGGKKSNKKNDKSRKRSRPEPAALPEGIEALPSSTNDDTAVITDPFANHDETIPLGDPAATTPSPNKLPKSKPKPKHKTKTTPKATNDNADAETDSPTTTTTPNHRFILFIGNLPYITTTESVTHHFRALQPFTVRHSTEKTNPKKSKGFAFLEFASYDRMKTCLKLYHHSLFDPEAHTKPQAATSSTSNNKSKKSDKPSNDESALGPDVPANHTHPDQPQWRKAPKDKTRRINVELTAGGGGGKSVARKDKIRDKNAKLAEERERGHKKEVEEREKKEKEEGGKGGRERNWGRPRGTGANADAMGDGDEPGSRGNVHPSRMRHVRG